MTLYGCGCLFDHYVMIFFLLFVFFFSIFIKGFRSNFLRNINCSIDLLANVHTQWYYSRKNQTEVTVFHYKKKTFTIQIMFFHRRCKTDVYRVLFDETAVLDSQLKTCVCDIINHFTTSNLHVPMEMFGVFIVSKGKCD